MKAVQRYGEGLASADYGDWWNRNAGLAGVGQQATNATAQAGQNAANNVSGAYQTAGNARASSYLTTGSAINRGLQGVAGSYLAQNRGGYSSEPSEPCDKGGGSCWLYAHNRLETTDVPRCSVAIQIPSAAPRRRCTPHKTQDS